jgi:hypothetical protein
VPPEYLGLANANGIFTLVLPARPFSSQPDAFKDAGTTEADFPQGDGIGTLTLTKAGVVTLAGTLADGTPVTASTFLSKDGSGAIRWPLFAALYNKLGFISGAVILDSSELSSDMSAVDGVTPPNAPLLWFRPYQNVQHYPYGWPEGLKVDLLGAKYVAISGTSVLTGLTSAHNADLVFSDGGLTGTVSKVVSVSNADIVTKVPSTDASYTLAITRATRKITGSFTHNVTNTKPAFQGMIFQKGAGRGAYGFFLTTTPLVKDYTGQSGALSLVPQP